MKMFDSPWERMRDSLDGASAFFLIVLIVIVNVVLGTAIFGGLIMGMDLFVSWDIPFWNTMGLGFIFHIAYNLIKLGLKN